MYIVKYKLMNSLLEEQEYFTDYTKAARFQVEILKKKKNKLEYCNIEVK